jgi:hypothetical protein
MDAKDMEKTSGKTGPKVYAQFFGSKHTGRKGDGLPFSAVFSIQVADEGTLFRGGAYLGRHLEDLQKIQFVVKDEKGADKVVAIATADAKNWNVEYRDGKTHKPEDLKFERGATKKSGSDSAEGDGRDLGPDGHTCASHVLHALGLVVRESGDEEGATKARTTLKVVSAQTDALTALLKETMKKAGMSDEQIEEQLKKIAQDAQAKVEAEKAEAEKAKAEKAGDKSKGKEKAAAK